MLGPKNMTGNTQQAPVYTSRWEERDARRRENARMARENSERRAGRIKDTLVQRVDKAKAVLNTKNTAGAIQTIQTVSSRDYDVYLLAEIYGQARKGVLRAFGTPRGSVEKQYLAEAGLQDPEAPSEEQEE